MEKLFADKNPNRQHNSRRDIVLWRVYRNQPSSSQVEKITIYEYTKSDQYGSTPRIVKISDDRLIVLWQEFHTVLKVGDLRYVEIDGTGKMISPIHRVPDVHLSNSRPIYFNHHIVWVSDITVHSHWSKGVTERTFYAIPVKQ